MRNLAIAGLAALTLAACGTAQQAEQSMKTSWVGQRADDFFVKHGAALRDQKLSDGRHVYVWQTTSLGPISHARVGCSADIVADTAGFIVEIRPREDSIGLWNPSRCSEIFKSS